MTGMKCLRCGQYWAIHTLWPHTFTFVNRFCPDCIPAIAPPVGESL